MKSRQSCDCESHPSFQSFRMGCLTQPPAWRVGDSCLASRRCKGQNCTTNDQDEFRNAILLPRHRASGTPCSPYYQQLNTCFLVAIFRGPIAEVSSGVAETCIAEKYKTSVEVFCAIHFSAKNARCRMPSRTSRPRRYQRRVAVERTATRRRGADVRPMAVRLAAEVLSGRLILTHIF